MLAANELQLRDGEGGTFKGYVSLRITTGSLVI